MKVVVTGANGFLGSALTKRLTTEGYDVHIISRPSSDLSEIKDLRFQNHIGDISDLTSLNKAFQGAEIIFHLAGVVAYKKSQRPLMDQVNVVGTQNVVTAMQQQKVKKLLHLSSVVAVGAGFHSGQILNEESEFNLKHLNLGYFETKRQAEALVLKAFHEGLIEPYIVNPSTIYGPADAKKGSRSVQLKVARGKFPFYTSGGVNVVSVEDVIEGILLSLNKGKAGQRYILSGENWTIRKLFQEIADSAQVAPPKILLPNFLLHAIGSLGDHFPTIGISKENAWTSTLFHWFDNSKAKNELGFNPRPAKFAIQQSVDWMKAQGLI